MRKIIILVFAVLTLYSAEPIQYGSYYGNIKDKMKDFYSYPENDVSSAGFIYLYNKNIKNVDYIYKTKIEHIKNGLKTAKEYAIKKRKKYFAIDNITHQVVITENQIIVMTHYNVLAFD